MPKRTRKRILVLVHESLVPPDSIEGKSEAETNPYKTEFDVVATLKEMGHEVFPLGVGSDLSVMREAVESFSPHIAFNLLEEFDGVGVFDAHVVSLLEMLRLPYTGCNPRGLMLAHNKAISKMICRHHRLRVPRFQVFAIGQRVRKHKPLAYPLIVKSLTEEGSIGISQASVVHDDAALAERVEFIHRNVRTDAIAEQYIPGRELYVPVMGNQRLQTFPVWEMTIQNLPEGAPMIASAKGKWDMRYRKQAGIDTHRARDLSPELEQQIARYCKRVYKVLQLSGYARMDLRLTEDGQVYLLEANPNPEIGYGEDFAESAETAGIDYDDLLMKIINLGMRYRLIGQA